MCVCAAEHRAIRARNLAPYLSLLPLSRLHALNLHLRPARLTFAEVGLLLRQLLAFSRVPTHLLDPHCHSRCDEEPHHNLLPHHTHGCVRS